MSKTNGRYKTKWASTTLQAMAAQILPLVEAIEREKERSCSSRYRVPLETRLERIFTLTAAIKVVLESVTQDVKEEVRSDEAMHVMRQAFQEKESETA